METKTNEQQQQMNALQHGQGAAQEAPLQQVHNSPISDFFKACASAASDRVLSSQTMKDHALESFGTFFPKRPIISSVHSLRSQSHAGFTNPATKHKILIQSANNAISNIILGTTLAKTSTDFNNLVTLKAFENLSKSTIYAVTKQRQYDLITSMLKASADTAASMEAISKTLETLSGRLTLEANDPDGSPLDNLVRTLMVAIFQSPGEDNIGESVFAAIASNPLFFAVISAWSLTSSAAREAMGAPTIADFAALMLALRATLDSAGSKVKDKFIPTPSYLSAFKAGAPLKMEAIKEMNIDKLTYFLQWLRGVKVKSLSGASQDSYISFKILDDNYLKASGNEAHSAFMKLGALNPTQHTDAVQAKDDMILFEMFLQTFFSVEDGTSILSEDRFNPSFIRDVAQYAGELGKGRISENAIMNRLLASVDVLLHTVTAFEKGVKQIKETAAAIAASFNKQDISDLIGKYLTLTRDLASSTKDSYKTAMTRFKDSNEWQNSFASCLCSFATAERNNTILQEATADELVISLQGLVGNYLDVDKSLETPQAAMKATWSSELPGNIKVKFKDDKKFLNEHAQIENNSLVTKSTMVDSDKAAAAFKELSMATAVLSRSVLVGIRNGSKYSTLDKTGYNIPADITSLVVQELASIETAIVEMVGIYYRSELFKMSIAPIVSNLSLQTALQMDSWGEGIDSAERRLLMEELKRYTDALALNEVHPYLLVPDYQKVAATSAALSRRLKHGRSVQDADIKQQIIALVDLHAAIGSFGSTRDNSFLDTLNPDRIHVDRIAKLMGTFGAIEQFKTESFVNSAQLANTLYNAVAPYAETAFIAPDRAMFALTNSDRYSVNTQLPPKALIDDVSNMLISQVRIRSAIAFDIEIDNRVLNKKMLKYNLPAIYRMASAVTSLTKANDMMAHCYEQKVISAADKRLLLDEALLAVGVSPSAPISIHPTEFSYATLKELIGCSDVFDLNTDDGLANKEGRFIVRQLVSLKDEFVKHCPAISPTQHLYCLSPQSSSVPADTKVEIRMFDDAISLEYDEDFELVRIGDSIERSLVSLPTSGRVHSINQVTVDCSDKNYETISERDVVLEMVQATLALI